MAGTNGTNFFTKISSTIDGAFTDESGNLRLIKCTAGNLPTGAGYAIGCIAEATDSGVLYYNTGTATVASFTAVNAGAAAMTVPSSFTDTTTTTGNAFRILTTAGTFTTGGAAIKADLAAGTAGNGLVAITTGAYTGTGLLLLTANSLTTGSLATLSATAQTSGTLVSITGGGANVTTGIVLDVEMGAATQGTGLKVLTSGVFAGSNNLALFSAAAATTTTGIVRITGTGLTSGTALYINATTATLTTGKYLQFYNGTGNDFTVGKYGATVIAGNAATDVFTITAGHAVVTSGNLTLTSGNLVLTSGNATLTSGNLTLTSGNITLTANSSVITCTGTGTNGMLLTNLYNDTASALSGTQRDIKIMIGATPYYFTVYPTKA